MALRRQASRRQSVGFDNEGLQGMYVRVYWAGNYIEKEGIA